MLSVVEPPVSVPPNSTFTPAARADPNTWPPRLIIRAASASATSSRARRRRLVGTPMPHSVGATFERDPVSTARRAARQRAGRGFGSPHQHHLAANSAQRFDEAARHPWIGRSAISLQHTTSITGFNPSRVLPLAAAAHHHAAPAAVVQLVASPRAAPSQRVGASSLRHVLEQPTCPMIDLPIRTRGDRRPA